MSTSGGIDGLDGGPRPGSASRPESADRPGSASRPGSGSGRRASGMSQGFTETVAYLDTKRPDAPLWTPGAKLGSDIRFVFERVRRRFERRDAPVQVEDEIEETPVVKFVDHEEPEAPYVPLEPTGTLDGILLGMFGCCCTRATLEYWFRGGVAAVFVSNGVIMTGGEKIGQDLEALADMKKLGLQEPAINKLYQAFERIDRDGSGEVSLEEYMRHFRLNYTDFAHRVFALLDADGSGEVDFREFVIATWNYCTFTHRALAVFAFNLFDADNSGQLERFEIDELVSAVYGDSVNNNERVKRVLDQLDGNGDGSVSREEWLLFNKTQPLLLFPAYQMQEALRSRIIGTGWWQAMQEKRTAQFRQKNIFEILEDMNDEDNERREQMYRALGMDAPSVHGKLGFSAGQTSESDKSEEEKINDHPLRGLPTKVLKQTDGGDDGGTPTTKKGGWI